MAKRQLNKQQSQRIADNRLALADGDTDLSRGLVVAHYGMEVELLELDGDSCQQGPAQRCHFRAKLETIVCGDIVLWRKPAQGEGHGVVETVLERSSVLLRPRPYEDPKPVAANLDRVVIVIAPEPEPKTTLIDRYLIAIENAGLPAALVINKIDLLDNAEDPQALELDDIERTYRQLGYPVYRCSALQAQPAAGAHEHVLGTVLASGNSILVGQSGVGKSSLINAICETSAAEVGDVSSASGKGRHTTTTAELFWLGQARSLSAGKIIDSPGIREFGLWHLDRQQVVQGLPEFFRLAGDCKFRDCSHDGAKGCAIEAAFASGDIQATRMASFRAILAEAQTANKR